MTGRLGLCETGRPDLVDEIIRAEWRTYGRHDDEDLIIQVRP